MCKLEDKKDNVVVEFCEKFKWKINASMFDYSVHYLYITNNTGRFTSFRLPSEDTELLTKNVKNNKYLVFSNKTYKVFTDVLDINLDEVIQLKRAIGGIYVEYYNNMLWITNARGFRQPIKLGKLLKAVNPDFTDKQVSDFVDKFNRYHDYDLSVISVSDCISEVYNYSHDSSGSIGGSCMKGCGEYFESLEYSCPNLKIAYIKDNDADYLLGRALLWEAYDSEDNQYKIMDRIYYDCEKTKILLEKYAEANGYYFRKEASGYCEDFYDTTTKTWVKLRLKVELKDSLIGTYTPYMDTFRYYIKNNNTLYNFEGVYYTNELTNTDGEAVYTTCDICGSSCADGSVFSNYHGERICESCLENYRYVESRDDYIHYDFVIQLRDTDTYFLQDDSYLVWVEDRGWCDYADNVHFVVDTEEYYEDTDELYYTEDTCELYSSNLDLYEYDGFYYSERQEDLEQQEEEV